MILWGNSLRLSLLGHRGSPLPIPGGLNNYAIGVCNGKIYVYTHIYKNKREKIKQFSQGSEQKECPSSETNSCNVEGQKQFISPHSMNAGMLWLCYPLTHSISGKHLKDFVFSKASLFLDLDWNHIPHHKRMLFQALPRSFTIPGCRQLLTIWDL